MQMTLQMITLCKEKTLKSTHSTATLSGAEETALGNCMQKYIQAPQIVMSQLQAQGGAGGDGF